MMEMDMPDNLTADNTSNLLSPGLFMFGVLRISTFSQITNILISILTIVFNGGLVCCLVTHKSLFPNALWCQMLTLMVSDMVAGTSPALVSITMFDYVNTNTAACTAIMMWITIAQFATILNLCFLSIRRFNVVRRLHTRLPSPQSKCKVILRGICPWIISFVCVVPGLSLVTDRKFVNGCVSAALFSSPKMYLISVFWPISLSIVPLLSLNIFYGYGIYIIRRNESKVMPTGLERKTNSKRSIATMTLPAIATSSNTPVLSITEMATAVQNNSTTNNTIVLVKGTRDSKQDLQKIRMKNKAITKMSIGVQRQAWKQLCLTLMSANITVWPYLITNICLRLGIWKVDFQNIHVIDLHLLCLNSIINPIIYGISVKEMRIALKLNISKIVNRCRR